MIPFTQYIRPNGRQVPIEFPAPTEVEVMANALIGRGYSFGVEDLGGLISLTCTGPDHSGEETDIAIELTKGDSDALLASVKKLITSAHTYVFGSKS